MDALRTQSTGRIELRRGPKNKNKTKKKKTTTKKTTKKTNKHTMWPATVDTLPDNIPQPAQRPTKHETIDVFPKKPCGSIIRKGKKSSKPKDGTCRIDSSNDELISFVNSLGKWKLASVAPFLEILETTCLPQSTPKNLCGAENWKIDGERLCVPCQSPRQGNGTAHKSEDGETKRRRNGDSNSFFATMECCVFDHVCVLSSLSLYFCSLLFNALEQNRLKTI